MSRGRKKGKGAGFLRPIQDVVNRLRWDPAFDEAAYRVGHEDRSGEVLETPLPDFAARPDIPWHRVRYVRSGEVVVWDRRTKLDRIFGSGVGSAPLVGDLPDQSGPGRALPIWTFDPARGAWTEGPAEDPPGTRRTYGGVVRLLTWNVLFDLHEPERLETERRVPAMLRSLEEADADLIALQEVTPDFLEALLAQDWVRSSYRLSDGPEASNVRPYGQVLLSRLPMFKLRRVDMSAHKRLILCELEIDGRLVRWITLHLASDWSGDGRKRRREQVDALVSALGDGEVLVSGDLNCDDEELGPLRKAGLIDCWATLHPTDPGYTFDPETNSLAKAASRSGRARRLDRVLVRDAGALAPRTMALHGTEPIGALPGGEVLHVSDHYGLLAELSVHPTLLSALGHEEMLASPSSHRTALVVLPPEELWGPVQAIREEHDRQIRRWMPHVNLLYPFVQEQYFPAFAAEVAAQLERFPPFELSLGTFEHFDHRARSTLWLRPDTHPPGRLEELRVRMEGSFPAEDRAGGFVPHLSVGQFEKGEVAEAKRELARDWKPLRFLVDRIHMIRRDEDGPFEVVRTLFLGRGAGEGPLSRRVPAPSIEEQEATEKLVLDLPGEFQRIGSWQLGLALPGSDLDLVAFSAPGQDLEEFTGELVERFRERNELDWLRGPLGAHERLLELSWNGVEIDLLLGRDALDGPEADTLARRCVEDAAAIRDEARAGAAALRLLKYWARRRGVVGNGLGFPSSMAWTLAGLRALRELPEAPLEEMAPGLFGWLAGRDWSEPLRLVEGDAFQPDPRRDRAPVLTPTPPVRNAARNVTRTTLEIMKAELSRAAALCRTSSWEALLRPVLEDAAHLGRLELRISAPDAAGERAGVGWVKGHALELLLAAERAGVPLRPYPCPVKREEGTVFVLGVDAEPVEADTALAEVTRSIRESFPAEAGLDIALSAWTE